MALTVAQLTARLTADTSNFYKSMSIADASLIRTGSVASRIGAGVGIAVGAIGVMALKTAGDFEQSMDILGATSGATTSQMKSMQDQAIALGKDMKLPNVSAKDAANAMTELSKAGLSVKDIMGATRGVLQLGVAANMNFTESATIVSRALTSFHMSGTKATQVADLLTATANRSTADINDLALGVQMASAQFHAAGFSLDDLTTSLGLMANAGIAGSDAGTSLKTMMNRLTAPTDKAKEAMKELGFSVYNSSGNVKKMPVLIAELNKALKGQSKEAKDAALYTIFGSDAIRAARVQLAAGAEGWKLMNAATTQGGEAQAFAEARTKGFNGAVQGLISQVETLAVQLGQAMLPAATAAAQGISNFVGAINSQAITGFFGVVKDSIQVLYNFGTANGQATPMLLGLVAGIGLAKFAIIPLVSGIRTLIEIIRNLNVVMVTNPITFWAAAVGAVVGVIYTLMSSTDSAASAQERLNSAMEASKNTARELQGALDATNMAELQRRGALIERNAAQKEVNRLEAAGKQGTEEYSRAVLRLDQANNSLKTSGRAVKTSIEDIRTQAVKNIQTTNESIKAQKDIVNSYAQQARIAGPTSAAAQRLKIEQEKLNLIYVDGAKKNSGFVNQLLSMAGTLKGPSKQAVLDMAKVLAGFNTDKARDKLATLFNTLGEKAPTAKQEAQLIGQGIADGIAAGITSQPAVQAAVKVVRDAIAAAQKAGKIKSPSQVAADEIGNPIASGIAQGIAVGGTLVQFAATQVVSNAIRIPKAYAKAGAADIAKGYSDTLLRGILNGTAQLPEKMSDSLKRMINKSKSVLDSARGMFDTWFGRLQSGALKAFDAVTQAKKTVSELALEGKTPSEIALGGKTASEKELSDAQAQRDADALRKRESDAQAVINGSSAAKAAIVQKEGEDEAEFRARQAEEFKRIDKEVADAREVISDVAWERRRATLETNAASERALLETKAADERKTLEAAATQERLDWESRRENERIALEDRLTKLQQNLLNGKISIKGANKEINDILRASGADYATSGAILGREFAAGIAASKRGIIRQARLIASAIQRILQLNSPADEGPLSTLDTWWDAFVPTLTSGLDTRGLENSVKKAVASPSFSSGAGGSGSSTITVNVSDQTFAGMSREQADSVARDIKAALDRQVSYTI